LLSSGIALIVLTQNCHRAQSPAWDEERLIAGTVSVLEEALPTNFHWAISSAA
jgi:hypothetical protein